MKISLGAAALFLVGLTQMAGDLWRVPALRGIGAATALAPAPRVFSAVRGYETYSTRFLLELPEKDGTRTVELTPELSARLRGPYNRRNVYGAVIAYGPVLPEALRQPVLCAVADGKTTLLEELGIDARRLTGPVRVRYVPREGSAMKGLPSVLQCTPELR